MNSTRENGLSSRERRGTSSGEAPRTPATAWASKRVRSVREREGAPGGREGGIRLQFIEGEGRKREGRRGERVTGGINCIDGIHGASMRERKWGRERGRRRFGSAGPRGAARVW
jgi:hypothetical protein